MELPTERPGLEWVLDAAWQALIEGARSARHPYHCPALATAGASGPAVRTVVLREANPGARSLACHTDRRSPKFAELQASSRAAWMFYDPHSKVQVRASGNVTLHLGDELAEQRWAASATRSQACYQAPHGPGARLDPGQPEALPPVEGFDQFVVLRCRLDRLDWLHLRGAGHWRAQFNWLDQAWQGAWVAP
jgi:hypothetical protein